MLDGTVVGQLFAAYWTYSASTPAATPEEKNVCWITQLVIHRAYRERGIATALVRALRRALANQRVHVYGVLSSNAATCFLVARECGGTLRYVTLRCFRCAAGFVRG